MRKQVKIGEKSNLEKRLVAERWVPERPKSERLSVLLLFRERENARAPKNWAFERPEPELNYLFFTFKRCLMMFNILIKFV